VTDELVFTVENGKAVPAQRISMAAHGLKEVTHLQEWVLAHPQILGSDAKIVTSEFARWRTATDTAVSDRLDVLAINRAGRLIVAELKRDKAPDTVTMQAINYAAMVRRFSLDTLAEVHARYLGAGTTAGDARQQLIDWADELSDETLGPPQIVLLASEFGPTVTNTALFLFESGIDIQLRRYQLYSTVGNETVLTVSQLIPVPEADQFMIKPRSSAATETDARARQERRATVVARLIAANAIPDRTRLRIVVPQALENGGVISDYLAAKPERAYVEWRTNEQQPVYWLQEMRSFDLNGLVKLIVTLATGTPPQTTVTGSNWSRDEKGRTLAQIANAMSAGSGPLPQGGNGPAQTGTAEVAS
jgi:hypothetical protein